MNYLLSVALGPVQDFIAAARRTRDLRYGSWLLSELSKTAARELLAREYELIFPHSDALDRDLQPGVGKPGEYAVVNKLLAVVTADGDDDLRDLVDSLRDAARARLFALAEDALKEARKSCRFDRDRVFSQLENFIELYGAWTPLDGAYDVARRRVEEWAAARKVLRDFKPHSGAERPKSSLDGVRETVFLKNGIHDNQYFIKSNEQLDGIGILKRFVGENPRFESTIDVAAAPYVANLRQQKKQQLEEYEAFVRSAPGVPFSHGYLYRHDSRAPKEIGGDFADNLERKLKSWNLPEPRPPYYVFFLGDGDGMGDFISSIKFMPDHQKFSARLSNFANDVRELAAKHQGWNIVFAGGDDVMALLPLHEALDAAGQIRAAFANAMSDLPEPPTFSAGMAIVHALDPLTEARRLAKAAEFTAKRIDDQNGKKNALAIIASPRSGAPVSASGHWDDILADLTRAVGLYVARAISPGFAHELRNLLESTARRRLSHLDETLFPLARAIAAKKDADVEFLAWLDELEQRAVDGARPRAVLSEFAARLLVARPIARSLREARG